MMLSILKLDIPCNKLSDLIVQSRIMSTIFCINAPSEIFEFLELNAESTTQ